MRTIDYLNAVQTRYGLTSDYQLAHKLGITRASASQLRNGKGFLGEDTAIFIAQLLDLPPARVIAHSNAERAERANKPSLLQMWLGVAAKYGATTAAAIVVGVGLGGMPAPASVSSFGATVYIMSTQNKAIKRLFRLVLPLFV
jgi:transcriptional regulator with XRE-family HTH domain